MKLEDLPKPFIIAEIGSNWQTLEDCLSSIRAAKLAGANAAKFQLFNELALYGYSEAAIAAADNGFYLDTSGLTGVSPWLDPAWLPALKKHCDHVGIEFMCSAFSPEFADQVNKYVNIHKVASSEMYHKPLLDRLNTFGKPVIMSTAASTEPDIKMAMKCLPGIEVCLMYCVGAYPAKDVDLRVIGLLKNLCPYVGYSDHTTDVRIIPRAAYGWGACVIEKHFTATDAKTADSEHSLNPREFRLMVEAIRGIQSAAYLGPQPDERDMMLKHKRRLKATSNIAKGETLSSSVNFGAYRSLVDDAHALAPFHMEFIEGTHATRDISVGEGIGPGDFD